MAHPGHRKEDVSRQNPAGRPVIRGSLNRRMASRANRGRLRLVESVPEAGDRRATPRPPRSPASPRARGAPDRPRPPRRLPEAPAARAPRRGAAPPPSAPRCATCPTPSSSPSAAKATTRPSSCSTGATRPSRSTSPLGSRARRHDVEDIAHDAFLRAFERLNDLTDRGAFRSWLGAIVVHAVRSRMRRQRLLSVLGMGKSAEPVDLDAIASSDASPHTRAQIAQIYALLRTLPTDDRIAWTLRAVEGHDLETVARLTRCSLATVKRRISRAQHFLDDHFIDPTHEGSAPELAASPDPKEARS